MTAIPSVALLMAAVCALQLSMLWDHPDSNFRLALVALTAISALGMIWGYALLLSGSIRAPSDS